MITLTRLLIFFCAYASFRPTVQEQRLASPPIHYFVSLPDGWTAKQKWPVVMVITDAYREFEGTAQKFADARSSGPFIIVVPEVLSGGPVAKSRAEDFDYSAGEWAIADKVGNCRFDADGIAAIIRDVRQRYNGDDRVFLTGWEAGGHVVLAELFNHPDLLSGVVAVTPNFQSRCVSTGAGVTGRSAAIPVRGFHGSEDTGWGSTATPWLLNQWHDGERLAKARGFTNVSDSLIPGQGRGAMPASVLRYFENLLGK